MLEQFVTLLDGTFVGIPMLLQSLLVTILVATALSVFLRCRQPDSPFLLELDPHLRCQSEVIDNGKNIRCSNREWLNELSDEVHTVRDLMRYGMSEKKDELCFGRRENFNAPANWTTFAQVERNIWAVGYHLHRLTRSTQEKEKFIGIYGRNSPEWVCTQLACGYYGLVAVPLYETLGSEALQHIMQQTAMQVVVCDTVERARKLLNWAQGTIEHIIIMETDRAGLTQLKLDSTNIPPNVHAYNELLARGLTHPVGTSESVNPDNLFLICYTSGSTGLPKGVMHTHRSFIHATLMADSLLDKKKLSTSTQVHLSFLPLAHIMEQLVMATALLRGVNVTFLTTDISGLSKDLLYYRPTIFCAVPRILSRMYMDFMRKIRPSKWKLAILDYVIRTKLEEQATGVFKTTGILDSLFFRDVRRQLGGRVEQLVCGSAPLPTEVLQFIKAAVSCPVYEGYGSTEAGGLISATIPTDQTTGHAGSICPSVKVKLRDVPSMGLVSTRDGTGEICVKSAACTSGYYKDYENTRDLFDEDGFLRTGDIGLWNENGSLKIVDRCKSIFKLSQGEYVAPEKVEQIYSTCPLVQNVFLDGHSASSFAVAVVVPDCEEVWRKCSEQLSVQFGEDKTGQSESSLARPTNTEICENSLVRKIIFDELTAVGQRAGLKGFEQARAIYLCPEPFTTANGLLTPTLKMARPNVRRHFAAVIDDLYD